MPPSINSLESAFEEAQALPVDARQEYLRAVRREDPELATRLESMLAARDPAEGFFAQHPIELASSGQVKAALDSFDLVGTQIGAYRITEKIAEGGCGTVYKAEQHAPLRRVVALKIIKAGMDTVSVVGRFDAERQALALMDHPNIAKVFDAGSTKNGRPYFVMELVDGVKITEYCAEHQLSINDRLQLFLQVCDGVQHAHQKGIVHRDLKPSNILVRGEAALDCGSPLPLSPEHAINRVVKSARGLEVRTASGRGRFASRHSKSSALPKVIDFGIAKAIQGKLTDKTIQTLQHHILGTPAYMSPEQADLNPDIDTRTDVYSLGVLLYELLTGKPPFDNHELLTAGLDEMRRVIREVEPKPPSQIPNLNRDPNPLDPDLDCIILKCLEKDRSRRYETISALAADIHRHLDNEPVIARRPTAFYRFQKLVARRKMEFAAVAFALTALVGAVILTTFQAIKARRAELVAKEQARIATEQSQIANRQSLAAEEAKNFLITNLLGVDCCGQNLDADALTFEATQALVKKVARQLDGNFTNAPGTEADIRIALAKSLQAARDYSEIERQAEKAYNIRRRLLGASHINTLEALKYLAHAKGQVGKTNEAFLLLMTSINALRAASITNPISSTGYSVIGTYGILLMDAGDPRGAIPYLQECVDALRNQPNEWMAWLGKLCNAYADAGEFGKAEEEFRKLHRLYLTSSPPNRVLAADAEFGLARVLLRIAGRSDEALPILQRTVNTFQRTQGTTNFATLNAQYFLAFAYRQQTNVSAAAEIYKTIYPGLVHYLPWPSASERLQEIAAFFIRQSHTTDAQAIYGRLRSSWSHDLPERLSSFDAFVRSLSE